MSECVFFTAVFRLDSDQEICRAVTRPKDCPRNQKDLCTDDSTCSSGLKCCNTGCRKECTRKSALLYISHHFVQCYAYQLFVGSLTSIPSRREGWGVGGGGVHSRCMPEKVKLHTYGAFQMSIVKPKPK